MLYRIEFAEWNLHGNTIDDVRKRIQYFKDNNILPKITKITEQTKEEYLERIMTEDDRIRSLKYRTINNIIKE